MSDISAVGGTTTVTQPADDFSSTALQGIDKDMFLKLLVAQMQYQNPMNPVDSTEFLNQAAQYASVEQLENMATQQAELRSLQMITVATGMVGNEVTAVDPVTSEPITGTVSGVQFSGAEPMLVIGNSLVPITSVVEMGPSGAVAGSTSGDELAIVDEATTPADSAAAAEGTDTEEHEAPAAEDAAADPDAEVV